MLAHPQFSSFVDKEGFWKVGRHRGTSSRTFRISVMNGSYRDLPPFNNQLEERFEPLSRVPSEEAALKLLELAPLCLSVFLCLSLLRKDVFYYCATVVGP